MHESFAPLPSTTCFLFAHSLCKHTIDHQFNTFLNSSSDRTSFWNSSISKSNLQYCPATPAHRTAAFHLLFSVEKSNEREIPEKKGKTKEKELTRTLFLFLACLFSLYLLFCGSIHVLFVLFSLVSFSFSLPLLLLSLSPSPSAFLFLSFSCSPFLLFLLCLLVGGEYGNNRINEKKVAREKRKTPQSKKSRKQERKVEDGNTKRTNQLVKIQKVKETKEQIQR